MNLCNKGLGRRGGAVKHCVVALYKNMYGFTELL